MKQLDVKILSRREAAKMLDMSTDTLDRLARRNEGPPRIKLSIRRCGYRAGDIREWQDRRLAEAGYKPESTKRRQSENAA